MTLKVIRQRQHDEKAESDNASATFLSDFLTKTEQAHDKIEYIDECTNTTYAFAETDGQPEISMQRDNFSITVTPKIPQPFSFEVRELIRYLLDVDNVFTVGTELTVNGAITYGITKTEHVECTIKSRNLYEINKNEDRKCLKLRFNSKLGVIGNMAILFFNCLLNDQESFEKNLSILNIHHASVIDNQGNRTINIESDALGLPNKKGGFCQFSPVDPKDPEYYAINIYTKKLSYFFKISQEFPLLDAVRLIEGFLVGEDPFNIVRGNMITLTACFPGAEMKPSHADRFEFKRTAGHVHLTVKSTGVQQ